MAKMEGKVISLTSAFVAFLCMVISLFASCDAHFNFLLANRPYLIIESMFIRYVEHGPRILDLEKVRFVCIRTPVTVLSVYTRFYAYASDDMEERLLHEKPPEAKFIVIPSDTQQITHETCSDIWGLADMLKPGEELRRRIEVKYEWGGKNWFNKTYLFSEIMQLDRKDKAWDIIERRTT